jgi:hypothetical protein
VNQNLKNKSPTLSVSQATRVRIPWKEGDTITKWNETCAWAMEKFGLPGDKYSTHPTEGYMDFYFQDEKDAIHFSLRWL